jgi:transcriptional regulator with XRE-family HTH domain
MAKKKRPRYPKEHPALLPKLAWQELIQHLMATHNIKTQCDFAEKVEVTEQTVSRWLGDRPAIPDPSVFEKVARAFDIPESQLESMWLSFMNRHDAYPQGPAADSEIAESSPAYDAQELIAQAEALEQFSLDVVPLDQRPPLHQLRRHIFDLVSHHDETTKRFNALLRLMISSFRRLFQSAIDTARKMSTAPGP